MAVTQENQVANVVNQLIATAGQLVSIQQQINNLTAQWNNLGISTMLAAFPTAPLTTIGNLGTADGSPNTAHPIDTRTPDGSLISRPLSATQIQAVLTCLQGVASAIGGSAVAAQSGLPYSFALCV